MNYTKNDVIKFDNKYHECIISNKEIAVFAPIIKHRQGGRKLLFKNIIVLSNWGTPQYEIQDYSIKNDPILGSVSQSK